MEIYLLLIAFVAIVISLGVWALVLWIGYRLIVSAVRAGVLEANAEQTRRDKGLPPSKWSILAARVDTTLPPSA